MNADIAVLSHGLIQSRTTYADKQAVDQTNFPWRPLGALLVDRGVLTAAELERALAEQRRSGRLLGQVLVRRGYVNATTLVRVLAEQHGVGLNPVSAPEPPTSRERPELQDRPWRPLGRVLVEKGFLTNAELERVLDEQREHPDRLLGEILVADAFVSGYELAEALAEQQGVELDAVAELGEDLETIVEPVSHGGLVYRVYEVEYEPVYRPGRVLYESASLLEAADFAGEYVQRREPIALEIEKRDGPARETVWTYSEARADAKAASREKLVRTFGFDPVRWGSSRN
jgi:hypothetical protein